MTRRDATAASTFYGLGTAAATLLSFPIATLGPASCANRVRRRPGRGRAWLRRLIPLFAGAWLAACSASSFEIADQPVAAPPPQDLRADQARLYFYRPNDSLFPAIRPQVVINGRKVGTSVVGEAFYRDAKPGRYVIFLASDDDDRLSVVLQPGEVHYVRTSISLSWLGPHLSPKSVAAEQGERELQSLLLVEPRLKD
jgi:hypothetical protein